MAVFRYLYAPLYFFGFVGGATALVSSGSSPAWLFVLIIAAIGTSLAAERIAPFENQWNSSHGDGRRDVLHALVNEGSRVSLIACRQISNSAQDELLRRIASMEGCLSAALRPSS